MQERIPVAGLPEPQFRPLMALEDDGYDPGGPMSGKKKPPHILDNKREFEELLRGHFGVEGVRIDIDW